ncbi:MAG: hypothetical protein Q7R41_04785 [Phycisphaerales bacterium]|nr:hypothetical protein [Phycisphaerales bacterium]
MVNIDHASTLRTVVLSVSRARAVTRGLLCLVPALLLGAATFATYSRLHFVPTAISNRLVDYSIAVALLPCSIFTLVFGFRAVRWLLLSCWPGDVAIVADETALTLRLGPFGTRAYDAGQLDARYPFEQSGDFEDGGFEAYLPEEEQRARFLPSLTHPGAPEPLHRTILRFAVGTEPYAAAALRPVIDHWRTRRDPGGDGGSGGDSSGEPV